MIKIKNATSDRNFRLRVIFAITQIVAAAAFIPSADAATYYVSSTGNDANSASQAQHAASAWATINHAASQLHAGDTLQVLPGTYSGVYINNLKGTVGEPVTIVGANPQPYLTSSDGNTVEISHDSYIIFKNINVTNTLHVPNTKQGGNGITIDGGSNHITIQDCTIHDCGAGGVGTGNGGGAGVDYITVKHNLVFNNAWYAWWQCSGISFWMNQNADPSDPGIHNYIVGNICHNNGEFRVTDPSVHTDGNGIIVDVGYSQCDKQNGTDSPDAGTLVAYNTCYNNGGCGVHVYLNNGVVFDHNTCYHNCADPHFTGGGELSIIEAANCKLTGNIADSSGSKLDQCVSLYQATNPVILGNLYFNGKIDGTLGANTLGDPGFKAPDSSSPNFNILKGGPADAKSGTIGAWAIHVSH